MKKSVNFETMKAHGLTPLTLLLNVSAVHVRFAFALLVWWCRSLFYFCPIVKCKVSYTDRGFLTPYFSVLSFGFKSTSSCTGQYLIGSIPDIAFCPAAPAAELSVVPWIIFPTKNYRFDPINGVLELLLRFRASNRLFHDTETVI